MMQLSSAAFRQGIVAKPGKVLGGQAIGEGGRSARMNVISLAENYDALNRAADFAVKKLQKNR
jgi:hypothetical protein